MQRAIRRKGRLVMRQVETRRRLVAQSASSPVLDNAIGAWLSTVTVWCLRVAGVLTLADLLLLIRVHGYRWYRNVPRIGELLATRLVTWLGHREQTLGPPRWALRQPPKLELQRGLSREATEHRPNGSA